MRSLPAACVVGLALIAGGCEDDEKKGESPRPPVEFAPPQRPPGPDASQGRVARMADVRVIRRWADMLRAGRVAAAARYFSVPAVVENGPPALELSTPAAVRLFNRSLPCGARLVGARRVGRFTIATFLLTDRPGGDCGSGIGHRAATAFRFRRGKIEEWRRVPVPEERLPPPAPEGEI
jgi:hypothetical protein